MLTADVCGGEPWLDIVGQLPSRPMSKGELYRIKEIAFGYVHVQSMMSIQTSLVR